MQALAAVVFERTPEGAAQVSAGSDTLPRALRSVLLAVDGRSSVARYEPFLLALMPLDEKFVALEQLGLLRRKGNDSEGRVEPARPALTIETAEVALTDTTPVVPSSDFESELQALSRQMGVIPDNFARSTGQDAASSVADATASLADPADKAALLETGPQHPPERLASGVAAIRLEDLLAEMEAFLSQAVGMDGLPVAIMVAQISSIAQLRQEMPSYSELMRSYGLGAITEAHLAGLEAQLARCS